MFDFKINETGSGGSIEIKGNDIVGLNGFGNMIYLALFGGNYTSTPSRRPNNVQALDYWGNTFLRDPKVQFNSTTERVLSEVALNSDGRLQIEKAVNFDLEFMKPFANVFVSVEIPEWERVRIKVILTQPENPENKDFIFIWDGTRTDNSDFTETELKISDSFSPAPSVGEPVTVKINGNTMVLAPSGSVLDIELIDTDDVEVGTIIDEDTVQVEKAIVKSGVLLQWPLGMQYTSYRTGDVGWRLQNGYFDYTIPENPEVIAELDSSLGANAWYQLKNPLKVGGVSNTLRFVDVDGIQAFGVTDNVSKILIDKLTGIGIYRFPEDYSTANWNGNIDAALSFSVVVKGITYSDFFLMSIEEYLKVFGICSITASSLKDNITSVVIMGPSVGNTYHTSTSYEDPTTLSVVHSYSQPTTDNKTSVRSGIYVFDARSLISAP